MSTTIGTKGQKTAAVTPAGKVYEYLEEKISERGAFSLSDIELLAILLRKEQDQEPNLKLAKALLKQAGNSLFRLSKMSVGAFCTVAHMSQAQAYVLRSALELARRLHIEKESEDMLFIYGTQDVKKVMRPYLGGLPHEEFWVLLLDPRQRLLGRRQISTGSLQKVAIDNKTIFRMALGEPNCTHLILVHNHPSGNLRPSQADKALTQQLLILGLNLDLHIKDHVIYSDEGCYSFADEGLLDTFLDQKKKPKKKDHENIL